MDNYFKPCPAMMDDRGRHVADFKTSTRRNEYIKFINGIVRDDEYRLFLQKYGTEFMNKEWHYYRDNFSCHVNDCVHKYPTRQSPMDLAVEREIYDSKYNKNHKILAPLRKCEKFNDYRICADLN